MICSPAGSYEEITFSYLASVNAEFAEFDTTLARGVNQGCVCAVLQPSLIAMKKLTSTESTSSLAVHLHQTEVIVVWMTVSLALPITAIGLKPVDAHCCFLKAQIQVT